jgi:hypothetical protein
VPRKIHKHTQKKTHKMSNAQLQLPFHAPLPQAIDPTKPGRQVHEPGAPAAFGGQGMAGRLVSDLHRGWVARQARQLKKRESAKGKRDNESTFK